MRANLEKKLEELEKLVETYDEDEDWLNSENKERGDDNRYCWEHGGMRDEYVGGILMLKLLIKELE